MKKRNRIILTIIGAVWLILVLAGTFLQCNSFCEILKDPDSSCGCSSKKIFLTIDVYGLPSWVLFFIALEAREKIRKRKR